MSQSDDAQTTEKAVPTRSGRGSAGDVDGSTGMNQGMQVLSYLIAGIAVYGALGWLGDHLLGTRFLVPVGLVVGASLAMYMVIKRFGGDTAGRSEDAGRPADETRGRP